MNPPQTAVSRGWSAVILILSSFLIFLLFLQATVRNGRSDPYPTPIVAQTILQQGTIRLDRYQDDPRLRLDSDYRFVRQNGHYFSYFPAGSAVFSLPFVWLANQFGLDMLNVADNLRLQAGLSALSCVGVFWLFYQIGRSYLPFLPAFVIALVSVLGSSVASTMGTGLWNINFAVLFITLVLWLVVRVETGQSATIHPYWLGFLLFAAYFCRPSTAVFILVMMAYLGWQRREELGKTAVTAFLLLLLLSVLNQWQYGDWLPTYSTLNRFAAARPNPFTALYGLLLSPSRGLFTFSPFLGLVFLTAVWQVCKYASVRVGKSTEHLVIFSPVHPLTQTTNGSISLPLVIFTLIWFGLQLLLLTRTTRWWGGWSYGPRLLTELVPGFALMTVLLYRFLSSSSILRNLYLFLALIGIFLHSVQGLFNPYVTAWNGSFAPNIDAYPAYLLDWRFPQFLASYEQLCQRNLDFVRQQVEAGEIEIGRYQVGNPLSFFSDQAAFSGWWGPDIAWRWSQCPSAYILLQIEIVGESRDMYWLDVTAGSLGSQPTQMFLNGALIGEVVFNSPPDIPEFYTFPFSANLLRPDELNEIVFTIPGTSPPNENDPRQLGLAFVSLTIR